MKLRLGLFTLLALVGCLNASPSGDEAKVSTVDQEVQSCTSSCDPPAYNGVPVSCTSNVVCVSQTEGVGCLADDQTTVNVTYCAPIVCGDHVCTRPYENATGCPGDCAWCGDGICTAPGETTSTCPEDCGCPTGQAACCGDGICYPFIVCNKHLC